MEQIILSPQHLNRMSNPNLTINPDANLDVFFYDFEVIFNDFEMDRLSEARTSREDM